MIFKKRENLEDLIKKQIKTVKEGIQALRDAVAAYLTGNQDEFKQKAHLVDNKETQADKVKRKAEVRLYRGEQLPIFREDFTDLMELVDNIADDAEKITDFLLLEHPKILPQWRDKIERIIERTWDSFNAFERCFNFLYEDVERAFSATHEVEDLEKEIDKMQDELIHDVFQSSELSLAEKIHFRQIIINMGYVSDSAENASDKVGDIALKTRP